MILHGDHDHYVQEQNDKSDLNLIIHRGWKPSSGNNNIVMFRHILVLYTLLCII